MSPRLLIIEGPDGSGKSTLAKFLTRKLSASYMHMSGHRSLHQGMLEYHSETLASAKFTLDCGTPVIIDRHWPSEWCYGKTLRPSVTSMVYDFERVLKELEPMTPIYIFCQRKTVSVRNQFLQLDEAHPFDESDYTIIHSEYHSLVESMVESKRYHVIQYDRDVQGHDLASFTKEVLNECH